MPAKRTAGNGTFLKRSQGTGLHTKALKRCLTSCSAWEESVTFSPWPQDPQSPCHHHWKLECKVWQPELHQSVQTGRCAALLQGRKKQKLVFFQKVFLSVAVLSWYGLKCSLKALTTSFWGITSSFLIFLTLQHLAKVVSHAQIYLEGQTAPLLILCVNHNFMHLHLPKPELHLRSCKGWDLSLLHRQIKGTQEGKTVQCCSHIFIKVWIANCHSLVKIEFITVLALTTDPSHLPRVLQLPLPRLPRHKALF